MQTIETIGSEQEHFTIDIRPTSKCNYDCYYCTDTFTEGLPGHCNTNPTILQNTNWISFEAPELLANRNDRSEHYVLPSW